MPRISSTSDSASLVWSASPDAAEEALVGKTAVLERENIVAGEGRTVAQVIRGENVYALEALKDELAGKVDIIYIDPPYNTGVGTFCYTDGRTSGQWLEFMAVRLLRARDLLSEQGVLYVSIDDRELGRLRMLLDEIFGEHSFLGMITWTKKSVPVNIGKAAHNLQAKCEYVLAYSRCKRTQHLGFSTDGGAAKKFSHVDSEGRTCRFEGIVNGGVGAGKRPTLRFPILGVVPPVDKQWKIGKKRADELLAMSPPRLALVDGFPKRVRYPADPGATSTKPFWSHLDQVGTAADGKRELDALVGAGHGFDTVKPVSLLVELVSRVRGDNLVVLDFFAGSGTTGHAVGLCNLQDGKNRTVILVTDDEANICSDVLIPRLRAAWNMCGFEGKIVCHNVELH